MPTPEAKEQDAGMLRILADRMDVVLQSLDEASRRAWSCPAADSFEIELAHEAGRLAASADSVRALADRLVTEAANQRAAELAAERAAAAAIESARRAAATPLPVVVATRPSAPPVPPSWRALLR